MRRKDTLQKKRSTQNKFKKRKMTTLQKIYHPTNTKIKEIQKITLTSIYLPNKMKKIF